MARVGDSGFCITVLTGAEASGFDLTSELRLVKAALLYADRVALVSPRMAMLEAASKLTDGSEEQRIRLIEIAASVFGTGQQIEVFEALRRRKGKQRPPKLIALQQQMRKSAEPHLAEVAQVIAGFRDQPGVSELYRARDAGALQLDGMGLDPIPFMTDTLLKGSGRRTRGGNGCGPAGHELRRPRS